MCGPTPTFQVEGGRLPPPGLLPLQPCGPHSEMSLTLGAEWAMRLNRFQRSSAIPEAPVSLWSPQSPPRKTAFVITRQGSPNSLAAPLPPTASSPRPRGPPSSTGTRRSRSTRCGVGRTQCLTPRAQPAMRQRVCQLMGKGPLEPSRRASTMHCHAVSRLTCSQKIPWPFFCNGMPEGKNICNLVDFDTWLEEALGQLGQGPPPVNTRSFQSGGGAGPTHPMPSGTHQRVPPPHQVDHVLGGPGHPNANLGEGKYVGGHFALRRFCVCRNGQPGPRHRTSSNPAGQERGMAQMHP